MERSPTMSKCCRMLDADEGTVKFLLAQRPNLVATFSELIAAIGARRAEQ